MTTKQNTQTEGYVCGIKKTRLVLLFFFLLNRLAPLDVVKTQTPREEPNTTATLEEVNVPVLLVKC